jgi:hypothetical protein
MAENGVGVPRTIWFLWFQGLDNAPYVVRKCHESWVTRNPTWRVINLDEASVPEFASVDYSAGNIGSLCLPHRADLLRLDLLSHHGGVWVDATCFCVRPLDDWLPANMESGFFAFHQPRPHRLISNWFLAAEPGALLVSRLFELMLAYWGDHSFRRDGHGFLAEALNGLLRRTAPTRGWWFKPVLRDWLAVSPYFAFAYGFEKLVREDPEFARVWAQTPKLSAEGPHRLLRESFHRPAGSPALRAEIDRGEVPLYKTNWRMGEQGVPSGSVLEYLLDTVRT